MKIEVKDGSVERIILIGMIVDSVVLGAISGRWNKENFKAKWANLVGGWCVRYYKNYGKAPKKDILSMFESWASEEGRDKDTIKLVDRLLGSLSEEYEQLEKDSNSQYIIDEAAKHFNKVAVSKLKDALEGDIDNGELDQALKRISTFGKVDLGTGAGVDVLHDKEAIKAAFSDASIEPIIKYPGPLGMWFDDIFTRDSFVSLEAPEKRGKSIMLQDIAWRGVLQQRKVAFIACGDMSQHQMMRRFMIRAAKRPFKATTIKYPKSIIVDGSEGVIVQHQDIVYDEPMHWKDAWTACREILNAKGDGKLFKLFCYPNSSLTIHGLKNALQDLERLGWVPDIVVVDYADIMAPLGGDVEGQDSIDATWRGLRRLSQEFHIAMITATQTSAQSYKANLIGMEHFSRDKRKRAHVTASFALNQTVEEKEMDVMRFGWVVVREKEYSPGKVCYVAGCRAIANPCIKSTM